jgi:hypothetical protein
LTVVASRRLRTIKIHGIVYFWQTRHRHLEGQESTCSEVFSAFREDCRRTPLRIIFPETAESGPGYPSQAGVVVEYGAPPKVINLNRPLLARTLIELALGGGWLPDSQTSQFIIGDGFQLLRQHAAALPTDIYS